MRSIASADFSIGLRWKTPSHWTSIALSDFNSFLIDHAACERKASATGMHFVVQYPDRPELTEPMIQLAREELAHFHQVSRLLLKRGLRFDRDERNDYINALLKNLRTDRDGRFLDRLLIFGIVEARGHERFSMIAEAIDDSELKSFYSHLSEAEERHHQIYMDLACTFFDPNVVRHRLNEFEIEEARIIQELPFRAAVH